MKKILSIIICCILAVSMPFTAFAGNHSSKNKDNSSGLGDLISGIFDSVSDSSGDLLDSLSDLAGDLSDVLAEAADEAGDSLSDIAEGAGDALAEAAEEIQDALPEAAEELQDVLSGSDENINESLSEILGGLQNLISGLTDTLNENGISVELPEDISDFENFDFEEFLDSIEYYVDTDELDDLDDMDEPDDPDDDDMIGRPAKIAGGWSVNDEAQSLLTEDEVAIFNAAIQGLLGVNYTPVAVLATQLVAGTNYAFLCSGTTVIPNATPDWYVVTVYADLKGNSAVLSIEEIELDDIEVLDDIDTSVKVGAWKIAEPEEPVVLPDAAQAAFEKATTAYVGVGFSPIALLGTQIVAGTNYKVLCFGTRVTKDPVTSLYVIDIYEDLEGEAQITSAELFDLTEYIDN